MWHTAESIGLVVLTLAIANPPVLNLGPLFRFNVILNCPSVAVNRKTDQTYSVAPRSGIFSKHFLIMAHRFLARWAPGCPEIKQNYLSLLVFNCSFSALSNSVYVNLRRIRKTMHLGSNTNLSLYAYFSSSKLCAFKSLRDFTRNRLRFVFLGHIKRTRNNESSLFHVSACI